VARGAVATDRTGGGGSGWRWKTAGLTNRVAHLSVRGEATGRLGRKRREEAGPKLLLGRESKRVKRKSILIDFWIKIGLEIE
jgi:hypothetical protein